MTKPIQSASDLREVLRDLSSTRDEARLKVHLFSLEARKRLGELEAEIEQLESQLKQRKDGLGEQVVGVARRVTHALKDLIAHQPEKPVQARDLMSRDVLRCHPWDSLNEAARLMWDADCGALPVVDDQDRVLGMITDRDICMAAYTRGLALTALLVDSAMSAKPISCAADASLRAVTDIMTSHQVRRVPIVSEDQHLLGIVSLADVAHFAQEPSLESREAQSYVPSLLAGVSRREAPETPL